MIAQLLQLPLLGRTASTGSTAGEVLAMPPEALLQAALEMIAEGAVSDLIDWCETLGHDHPQCSQFQAQALEQITQGHLARLRAMCEQALSERTESAAL